MNSCLSAATGFAAVFLACFVNGARAEEVQSFPMDRAGRVEVAGFESNPPSGEWTASPWTFYPVAEIRSSRNTLPDGGPDFGARIARLGVRGAATVDSRLGAIYSRLSLSFDHALQTNDSRLVTGLHGSGRYGYYASRSQVDVMMLDAAFALKLAPAVTGFVDYGAETDLGNGTEHQIALRLRFEF